MPNTKGDAQELAWIEIDDFSPGIITNSALTAIYPVPGNKLGQAQSAQGCIALPSGGLAPLPGLALNTPWGQALPLHPKHTPAGGTGAVNLNSGLFLAGPIHYFTSSSPYVESIGDELIIGQAQITSTGNQQVWIDSIQGNVTNQTSATNNIANTGSHTSYGKLTTMTGAITRANNDPADIGFACYALSYWYTGAVDAPPALGEWYIILYPDPTNPGTGGFAPYVLVSSVSGPGDVFCHQNRIGYLSFVPNYWTSDYAYLGENEYFYYTDPPNGLTLISGAEIFVQEDPSGYGAYGSQSASELFLVKNKIGGVVIQGDLNAPTVTVLPGVTPTYGLQSRGASTPLGFVYASANRGLWAWNGGNTSTKISEALDDNFFVNPHLPPIERGPTVDIQRWGDWIVTTNDWLFDTNLGGWWKLSTGDQGVGHQWYQSSSDGTTLYAAYAVPTSTISIECYSRSAPSQSFAWESFPIRPPGVTQNRSIDVREVVVRAQGDGTVTVGLTGLQGTTATFSPSATLTFETTADASQPSMQRLTSGLSAQDIQISITSAGASSGAAPIVYSVAIGYTEIPGKVSSG